MSALIHALKQARASLSARGWAGPTGEAMPWVPARRLCLVDALASDSTGQAWATIEAVVAPRTAEFDAFVADAVARDFTGITGAMVSEKARAALGEPDLQQWLEDPCRTLQDVAGAVVKAIERCKKQSAK